jgi:hypothetical protein
LLAAERYRFASAGKTDVCGHGSAVSRSCLVKEDSMKNLVPLSGFIQIAIVVNDM